MDSDADRLAMIKGAGGQLVSHTNGSFWAIFESAFATSPDGSIETRQPVLTARTSDVKDLPKDVVLEVGNDAYRIKRPEHDGSGITNLILKR